jgi:uncharacterized protein (DUF2141 family)
MPKKTLEASMTKQLLILIGVCFLATIVLTAQETDDKLKTGNLIIHVTGCKNDKGDVKIGLFNSKESWDGKAEKYKGAIIKIETEKATWIIADLPFGEYAVKTFHDEDGDDQVDTNFLGMPKERFGFSNNVKVLFGPPGYEKTKFLFNSQNMAIEIKLK